MKSLVYKACLSAIFIVSSVVANAQYDTSQIVDSLKKVILKEKDDTNKVKAILILCHHDTSTADFAQIDTAGAGYFQEGSV